MGEILCHFHFAMLCDSVAESKATVRIEINQSQAITFMTWQQRFLDHYLITLT